MSEGKRMLGALVLALVLPFCGYRERGLEVAIEVRAAEGTAAGTLEIDQVELLACPDVPAHVAALSLVSVARAHDTSAPTMGPIVLAMPSDASAGVVRMLPGSYCDVRVHFGSPTSAALATAIGDATEREVVLRLVDETGTPTRLLLARAPDRASIRIDLGGFSADATPAHALSEVIDGAHATMLDE